MKTTIQNKFAGFRLARILLLSAILLTVSGCSKDSDKNNLGKSETPNVNLYEVLDVTSTSAKLEGDILNYDKVSLSDKGFLISNELSTPNMNTWERIDVDNSDRFLEKEVSNLKSNTIYYVVAYAAVGNNIVFSSIKSFKTKEFVENPITISVQKTGIYYSASGFDNSFDSKYKLTYNVDVTIKDYSKISECGFKIGNQRWKIGDATENKTFTQSMYSISESSTITRTITGYAILKDGTECTGNTVSVSGTYSSGGTSGGGSSTTSNKRADTTHAYTYYSGQHSQYTSYASIVSSLNNYGLLIYKSGNSYYWKDLSGSKHTASPNVSYSRQIYDSDLQAGDKNNGYQIKKAYLYVDFRFSPF